MDCRTIIVILVLAVFVLAILVTAYVVKNTPETNDFEKVKIRFAAVTFTGIMLLVLLTAVLAAGLGSTQSMDVFKTVMTGLSPIAGGIIGYLFSSRNIQRESRSEEDEKDVKKNNDI